MTQKEDIQVRFANLQCFIPAVREYVAKAELSITEGNPKELASAGYDAAWVKIRELLSSMPPETVLSVAVNGVMGNLIKDILPLMPLVMLAPQGVEKVLTTLEHEIRTLEQQLATL